MDIISSLEDLQAAARRLAQGLAPQAERATLITLSGDLGAGKTAFTKELARVFGVTDVVQSPTFVLEKIYALPRGPFERLVHIDAYRLHGGAELAALGFEESMKGSENLVVLEWPEQVADALPPADVAITFRVLGDSSRTLTYEKR